MGGVLVMEYEQDVRYSVAMVGHAISHDLRQWVHCGGLSDIAAVHVLPDGRLQVDPQQLWPVQAH